MDRDANSLFKPRVEVVKLITSNSNLNMIKGMCKA